MNPLDLIPVQYRLLAEAIFVLIVLAAAAACGAMVMHWRDGTQLAKTQAAWAQERASLAQQVQQQQAHNIELQQAAEKKYVVQGEARDHYFVTTVKEIHDAAAPLAACPVPDAVRLRIDAAGDCARSDSPAACDGNQRVPDPAANAPAGHGG